MKYATILLLCAVAALAAPPTPCSPPETFQASQETIILNSNGCETTYQTGTVFFDYPSQVRCRHFQSSAVIEVSWSYDVDGSYWRSDALQITFLRYRSYITLDVDDLFSNSELTMLEITKQIPTLELTGLSTHPRLLTITTETPTTASSFLSLDIWPTLQSHLTPPLEVRVRSVVCLRLWRKRHDWISRNQQLGHPWRSQHHHCWSHCWRMLPSVRCHRQHY